MTVRFGCRPTAVSCSVLESYSEWNELPKSFAEDRSLKQEIDFLLPASAAITIVFKAGNQLNKDGPYYDLPCWLFVAQESLTSRSTPICPLDKTNGIPKSRT
ncbi:hypothetical protein FPQ18DRAFT_302250 [Pyronema domesticum]|nr:hypothetical protein FPQ18DRAFT_302250 [Pyronema domesticum]